MWRVGGEEEVSEELKLRIAGKIMGEGSSPTRA